VKFNGKRCRLGVEEDNKRDCEIWRCCENLQCVGIGLSKNKPDQGGRGPGAPSEGGEPPTLIGDVVVCPGVAQAQAPEHGATLDEELALLVVHGVLHLLNYDHADPREEASMQQRERELLARFREQEREAGGSARPAPDAGSGR